MQNERDWTTRMLTTVNYVSLTDINDQLTASIVEMGGPALSVGALVL